MIRASTEGCSTLGLELCVCTRCGALLTRYDFTTDSIGRTIENCSRCGPQLLAVRRGAPLKRVLKRPLPKIIQGCADCHGWMLWSGTGSKPSRCVECQERHQRADARQYQRDLKAGLRVARPRRMSA